MLSDPSTPVRYYVGLDVHRDTIYSCVYDASERRCCEQREIYVHKEKSLDRLVDSLRSKYGHFRCCYEASFSGTALYESLTQLGVDCAIIAPGSIPKRAGDRIKTDRRDARKLAKYFASGLLTECFVLDAELRAVRGLLRCREGLVTNLTRSKNQVIHFLHAQGHCYNSGRYWTKRFKAWINQVNLDQPYDEVTLRGYLDDVAYFQSRIEHIDKDILVASESFSLKKQVQILQGFRGIGLISAMHLMCEVGDFRRFDRPTSLMAYLGLVPSQRSSGNTIRPGSITKTGNAYARKVLVSAALKYRHTPRISVGLEERQKKCDASTIAVSQRAQKRCHKRFKHLIHWKPSKVVAVAVARELVGFLWEALQPHANESIET